MRAVMRMAMRRAMALRLRARSSSPSKYAAPPMRGSCPAMVLRMVDLPEPFRADERDDPPALHGK